MKNWSNKSLVGIIFGLTALIVIGASAPQIFNRIKVTDGILCDNYYNADGSFAFYSSDVGTITGKADKVSGAVDGNFAGLDATGNLTDSGAKPADYAAAASVANAPNWDQAYADTSAATHLNNASTTVKLPSA